MEQFYDRDKGKYVQLRSKNVRNFAGANLELKQLHNLAMPPDETFTNYLSSRRINWKFLLHRAPKFKSN